MDTDGSDGWSYVLDTTNYENGVYEVFSMVGEEIKEAAPSGMASAQVIIEN